MDSIPQIASIGVEGSLIVLLVVISVKIFRMKIHSRSGCCGQRFPVETMSRAGSRTDLEFTDMNKSRAPEKEDPDTAII
jgi:hypothetical protein